QVNTISDQVICNGSMVTTIFFGTVNSGGVTTYSWTNDNTSIGLTDNGTGNIIAFPAVNNGLIPEVATITVTPHFTNGSVTCDGPAETFTITVNPSGHVNDPADQEVCSGSAVTAVTFTSNNGVGTTTYSWTNNAPVIGLAASGTGDIASFNAVNNGIIPIVATITVTPHFTYGSVTCTGPSESFTITVNPLPFATLSGGATICLGESAILNVNLPVGLGPFEVDIDPGINRINYNSGEDIIVSPVNTTTYTITRVRDANGCEVTGLPYLTGSATVTVKPDPLITLEPLSAETCEYGIVTFKVEASGIDNTYQWYEDRGLGAGFTQVVDTGLYFGATTPTLYLFGATRDMNGYVYRAVASSCGTDAFSNDVTLTVNTAPEIIFQPKDTTICSTDNAAFGVVAEGTNLSYEWQFKAPSAPFATVVDDGINFIGQGTDTLRILNAPGSFNNYIFRLILDGTCGSSIYSNYVTLRVNVPPTVSKHPVPAAVCNGSGPVYFVSYGAGMIDSLRWQVTRDGGFTWHDIYDNEIYSGTTSQQLALIDVPDTLNNYQYRLAFQAFCATTYSNGALLTVHPLPEVTFAEDPIPACGGVGFELTPIISSGTAPWATHTWTGDVGPLNNYFIQNPTFRTLIADTYNLTYRVRDNNGCFGEGSVSVVVDSPDPTFTTVPDFGCTPAEITFTKDMTGMASWSWNFGDGTPVNITDESPVHTFINTTPSTVLYRTVTLTVNSLAGCTASSSAMVTVYPAVDASFTASDDSVCSGSVITFTAMPGASNYSWDFGDGTPDGFGLAPTHIYLNTGTPVTRTVKLVTTSFYGCKDSTTFDIVVLAQPQAQFEAVPESQTYLPGGNSFQFNDLTTPAGLPWNYDWDFGDGGSSSVNNPSHIYTGSIATFDVVLTVSNEKCSSQISHQVTILPEPPVADFDSIPSGCAPLSIEIKNTTVNKDTPGTTFLWKFGDGGMSVEENPTYTYFSPGTYVVELRVTGPGGTSTKQQVVHAYISPQAYFEVAPQLVYVNDERVRCFNLTQNADYYLWDFGDGDTSRQKEPFHKYMEEGVYDITLWAYSSNGCSDKYVLSPAVTVEPPGEVRFSTVFKPNLDGPIERTDLPTGGTEIDQFFFPPIREKVTNYKLQIFNRQGMLIFQSNSINIPWNGYYKGQLCPQGVYVWYVEGKYANGKPFKMVGDITLLH
nr:PKD domain-containing protein [Bacteroidales bacterium]